MKKWPHNYDELSKPHPESAGRGGDSTGNKQKITMRRYIFKKNYGARQYQRAKLK